MSQNDESKQPQVRALGPPEEFPVYNCLVYVRRGPDGFVARSATLADLAGKGDSERTALQDVVQQFKQRVASFVSQDQPIPWLEQPLEPLAEEQQRYIAVHL